MADYLVKAEFTGAQNCKPVLNTNQMLQPLVLELNGGCIIDPWYAISCAHHLTFWASHCMAGIPYTGHQMV